MKNYIQAIAILTIAISTGCSVLPYEENFACSRNPTYGKCVSVEGAYDEAVTGVEQGAVITQKGAQKSKPKSKASADSKSDDVKNPDSYSSYRNEQYDQLRSLIAEPQTPMVRKATESRTLILSYSPKLQRDRLYMPRYVYSIHKPAEFVLGQYLLEEESIDLQLEEFLNK